MSKALEALRQNTKMLEKLAKNIGYDVAEIEEDYGFDILDNTYIIEKSLKALDEILALYDKWLGHRISDFEFFTMLSEILDKYDTLKEVLVK